MHGLAHSVAAAAGARPLRQRGQRITTSSVTASTAVVRCKIMSARLTLRGGVWGDLPYRDVGAVRCQLPRPRVRLGAAGEQPGTGRGTGRARLAAGRGPPVAGAVCHPAPRTRNRLRTGIAAIPRASMSAAAAAVRICLRAEEGGRAWRGAGHAWRAGWEGTGRSGAAVATVPAPLVLLTVTPVPVGCSPIGHVHVSRIGAFLLRDLFRRARSLRDQPPDGAHCPCASLRRRAFVSGTITRPPHPVAEASHTV